MSNAQFEATKQTENKKTEKTNTVEKQTTQAMVQEIINAVKNGKITIEDALAQLEKLGAKITAQDGNIAKCILNGKLYTLVCPEGVNGTDKTGATSGQQRAPYIPSIPDTKTITQTNQTGCTSATVNKGGFATKQDAINYMNDQVNIFNLMMAKGSFMSDYRQNAAFDNITEQSVPANQSNYTHWRGQIDTSVQGANGDARGTGSPDTSEEFYVTITDFSIDYKSFNITQADDGTWSFSTTVDCNLTYDVTTTGVSWEAGDLYQDVHNGQTYFWVSDGNGGWSDAKVGHNPGDTIEYEGQTYHLAADGTWYTLSNASDTGDSKGGNTSNDFWKDQMDKMDLAKQIKLGKFGNKQLDTDGLFRKK